MMKNLTSCHNSEHNTCYIVRTSSIELQFIKSRKAYLFHYSFSFFVKIYESVKRKPHVHGIVNLFSNLMLFWLNPQISFTCYSLNELISVMLHWIMCTSYNIINYSDYLDYYFRLICISFHVCFACISHTSLFHHIKPRQNNTALEPNLLFWHIF